MTKMKTLSTVILLSTAVATPVFAKTHVLAYDQYRGAYNQLNGPTYAIPQTEEGRNIEDFGFSGRDPSRVGGEDPSLNPSGYGPQGDFSFSGEQHRAAIYLTPVERFEAPAHAARYLQA